MKYQVNDYVAFTTVKAPRKLLAVVKFTTWERVQELAKQLAISHKRLVTEHKATEAEIAWARKNPELNRKALGETTVIAEVIEPEAAPQQVADSIELTEARKMLKGTKFSKVPDELAVAMAAWLRGAK